MRPIGKIMIVIAVLLIGGTVFFVFNPEHHSWMPKCPFYALTGYKCAGCGTMRAIHNLLHLRFAQAWSYNPFLILMAPYLLLLLVLWIVPYDRLTKLRNFAYHYITLYCFLALLILWWVGRNLLAL